MERMELDDLLERLNEVRCPAFIFRRELCFTSLHTQSIINIPIDQKPITVSTSGAMVSVL